jgi:CRP-like cAMP-binding protein
VESIVTLIKDIPVFEGMKPEHLDEIAGCASNVKFNEGQVLFLEGDEANTFYVVRHGLVAIEMYAAARGRLVVQTVKEQEVVGWSWLFPPYQWHFDVRAVEPTRAIAFDARCLRGKCDENPELGYELMKRFARIMMNRIQATRLQILDVYGHARPRR